MDEKKCKFVEELHTSNRTENLLVNICNVSYYKLKS